MFVAWNSYIYNITCLNVRWDDHSFQGESWRNFLAAILRFWYSNCLHIFWNVRGDGHLFPRESWRKFQDSGRLKCRVSESCKSWCSVSQDMGAMIGGHIREIVIEFWGDACRDFSR